MLTKLCLFFLLCDRAKSSRYSVLHNDEPLLDTERNDLLGRFLVELKSTSDCLRIPRPRHVTFVGASISYKQLVQPVFENFPKILCSGARRCGYNEQFSEGNFVIAFVEDPREKEAYVEILSRCKECSVLFVCDKNVTLDDVSTVLNLGFEQNIVKVYLAKVENYVVRVYSSFLDPNCSVSTRLLMEWEPGVSMDKYCTHSVFTLRNLNGCPVTITSLSFPPKMLIEEDENGSLTIVGGLEGKLVLTLAEGLNFTISLRYPSDEEQLKLSRKLAIVNDVASGISEMGIGRLRPTDKYGDLITLSNSYDEEFINWGVPPMIKWSDDIVWVEFSFEVWICIGFVFGVTCIIGYANRNILSMNSERRMNLGFATICLDVLAIHLGNPALYVCSSARGRFMMTSVFLYAIVITTAYKSSLASILATDKGTPRIVDVQGIIDANLEVRGSLYDYQILQDQVNESKLSSVLERFKVNNNDVKIAEQLPLGLTYAFMARKSMMDYTRQMAIRNDKSIPFNVLDTCILAYQPVIVFGNKSLIRESTDIVIRALSESGILESWDTTVHDTEKLIEERNDEKYSETHASYEFKHAILLYLKSLVFSIFTFFMELLIHRLLCQ